jgi:hypothetical protein
MAVTPEMVSQVRMEIQDVTPGLYILDDTTITYYLTKNDESIQRASLDAARAVLMRLAMTSVEEVCDVISIKTKSQAEQYRLALQMYISNPALSPILNSSQAYFGGVSITDMQSNNDNVDNNLVTNPYTENISRFPKSAFEV